jgi:hypothetical protein
VTERTKLTLVALASAAMPDSYFTGARASDQASPQDELDGIDCAVVQNASGRFYDVWATSTKHGKKRLSNRVKAAEALEDVHGVRALGFTVEQILKYEPGDTKNSPTGDVAVAVMTHTSGRTRSLKLLTTDECASVGTAIAAIHRINPKDLRERFYPSFSTKEIASQLSTWISNLKQAGHIPSEITDSWASIIRTEGLWSFDTRMVHGGFNDGDFLFNRSGLTAIHNWQNMQVNDPARDLAWIFSKLDQTGRDAVIAAYGRVMGSKMDDLIMLRANLWLQMEQVGDFILSLERADNDKIIRFKAQVERLAEQLADKTPRSYTPTFNTNNAKQSGTSSKQAESSQHPLHSRSAIPNTNSNTLTVGDLLDRQSQASPVKVNNHPSSKFKNGEITASPTYAQHESSEHVEIATTTGRHAAAKPTLPDITGNHEASQAPVVALEEAVSQDAFNKHEVNSSQTEGNQEQPASSNTQTESIQRCAMEQLAHNQIKDSKQSHGLHSSSKRPMSSQENTPVSSPDTGTKTVIINQKEQRQADSLETQLVAHPTDTEGKEKKSHTRD